MPSLYAVAKDLLTETEKDRILCVYLNTAEGATIDWDACIQQSGSASIASFKKMVQNTMKKIKDKAAEEGDDAGTSTPAAVTPAKTPKSSGTKRKGKVVAAAGDDEEGTPTKKKRGKRVKAEVVDEDDEESAEVKESIE